MNEYLATDSGRYLYEQHSCIHCSVAGCFPERLRWCLVEQVWTEVYSALSRRDDWVLRYIRTYLYFVSFRVRQRAACWATRPSRTWWGLWRCTGHRLLPWMTVCMDWSRTLPGSRSRWRQSAETCSRWMSLLWWTRPGECHVTVSVFITGSIQIYTLLQ